MCEVLGRPRNEGTSRVTGPDRREGRPRDYCVTLGTEFGLPWELPVSRTERGGLGRKPRLGGTVHTTLHCDAHRSRVFFRSFSRHFLSTTVYSGTESCSSSTNLRLRTQVDLSDYYEIQVPPRVLRHKSCSSGPQRPPPPTAGSGTTVPATGSNLDPEVDLGPRKRR